MWKSPGRSAMGDRRSGTEEKEKKHQQQNIRPPVGTTILGGLKNADKRVGRFISCSYCQRCESQLAGNGGFKIVESEF